MTNKDKFEMSGRLPGNETNGLASYAEVFIEPNGPEEPLIGVVQIVRDSRTRKDETGEVKALAKIKRIEIAEGEDRTQLVHLLNRLTSERTGDAQLDLDGTEEDTDDVELDIEEAPAATVSDFPPLTPDFSDTPDDDGPQAA